jgi:hypothetical protein
MGEQIEARDMMTKDWVKKRKEAWQAGYKRGQELVAALDERLEPCPEDLDHQYLRYLYALGIAQAFTNRGRELGVTNFGRTQEEAQNKNRVPQ